MALKIAIQGQEASFHSIAAKKLFGPKIKLVCCETFEDTFESLAKSSANKAVVAIENSLFGSINDTYDLLLKHKFWISGELYLHVKQCLIGIPGTKLKDIVEVHSQLPALAQCEEYLDKHLPNAKRVEHYDTAAAAKDVKDWDDKSKTAIASFEAAKLYGLEVLASEIETQRQNYTRFVVLEPEPITNKLSNKTSLVIKAEHKPGTLHRALGVFAAYNMNLTKLQSRPIIDKAWHYMFYLDVAEPYTTVEFNNCLVELKKQGCKVKILGSYPKGKNLKS